MRSKEEEYATRKNSRIVKKQRRQVPNDRRIPDLMEGTIRQEKRDQAKTDKEIMERHKVYDLVESYNFYCKNISKPRQFWIRYRGARAANMGRFIAFQ